MNRLMALDVASRGARCARRSRVGLRARQRAGSAFRAALVPQADVEMGLPCEIGDYTDFYTSIHHATTVGKQFRPDNPLLPNYKWVPIGYHGRASSIGVGHAGTGHTFRASARADQGGRCRRRRCSAPSRRLDYELELGVFVGRGNALGEPVPIAEAEDARVRPRALQRLVRARHPGLGVPAARPVPVEELREHALAVDRDAGGAGAVPRLPIARPGGRPAAAALPRLGRQPRARRVRHRARGLAADRGDARGRPRRRPADAARTTATPTGRSRSWSRTTRSTAATCAPATCSASARCRARRPSRAARCSS